MPARTIRAVLGLACLVAVALPAPASACGGCFIPTVQSGTASPVLQDAERVLFLRDEKTKQSTVWVEVRYNGPSDDFGWVLPLPKVPKVGVGSAYLFDRLDLGTAPRFTTTAGSSENCSSAAMGGGGGIGCGSTATSAGVADSTASKGRLPGDNNRGVTVLVHDQVGPYDYVIIEGKTADGLIAWLNARKYAIPDLAKSVIAAHVQKGDVFVAVRLKTGATAQEVKPITLTMDDTEPCVPLRLTAIAAVDDLNVEVLLGGPGQAIPKNHLHVWINPMKLDWFDGASNYSQVVSAAIDEASGRAFLTEFAGAVPTSVTVPATQLYGSPTVEPLINLASLDTSGIAKAKHVSDIIVAIHANGFPIVSETALLLEQHLGLAAQAGTDNLLKFYQNAHEGDYTLLPADVTAAALAQDIDQNFTQPLKDVLPLLQGAQKLTRLVMRISPKEMTKDPIFGFHPGLPDVARDHAATVNTVCPNGSAATAYRLTLKGVGSYVIDASTAQGSATSALANNAVDPRFKAAPAASLIELVDETGDPVAIHPDDIDLVDGAIAGAHLGTPSLPAGITLKKAPARWKPPANDAIYSSGSVNATSAACALAPTARGPAALGLLLCGAALSILALRRRKRE